MFTLEQCAVCLSSDVLWQIYRRSDTFTNTATKRVFWLSDSTSHEYWHDILHDRFSGFVPSFFTQMIFLLARKSHNFEHYWFLYTRTEIRMKLIAEQNW